MHAGDIHALIGRQSTRVHGSNIDSANAALYILLDLSEDAFCSVLYIIIV